MSTCKVLLVCLFCFLFGSILKGQAPANDACESPYEIIIPENGFGIDTIQSTASDVKFATRQIGEICAKELEDNGNCNKTVWYKFYLPSTRNVAVVLTQADSAIPQIFSGFTIYKIKDCSYTMSDLSAQLTPLNKFGSSGNTCLNQGWYLIQVGCKQKAKGEIWINLEVSKPASDTYDEPSGFYSFMQPGGSQTSSSKTFNLQCASIQSDEAKTIQDSSFTKSIWFSFSTNQYTEFNQFEISSSGSAFKYRIFQNNLDEDSMRSNKPFIDNIAGSSTLTIFSESCQLKNSRKYFVQVVLESSATYLTGRFTSFKDKADNWSNQKTADYITINSQGGKSVTHTFNCSGFLPQHACKQSINSLYIKRYNSSGTIPKANDTFQYAGYIVVDLKESGLLDIRQGHDNYNPYYYVLFQGDIRNTCSLTQLTDTVLNDYGHLYKCMDPGIYTLLCVSKKPGVILRDLSFNLLQFIPDRRFIYPHSPEKMADYNPLAKTELHSDLAGFSKKDTTIKIGNLTFNGLFNYREVYITETGEFDIFIPNNLPGNMYVFSGQLSKGTAALIPGVDYSYPTRQFVSPNLPSLKFKSCNYLSKGYYTIVSSLNSYYSKLSYFDCLENSNRIVLKPIPVCPPNNNTEPQFAIPLNNNKNIFDSSRYTNDNLNYYLRLQTCKLCNTFTYNKAALTCGVKQGTTPYTVYSYYTFYLDENASLVCNTSRFELFKGNVLSNPALIKDSTNIVAPCTSGRYFCNLSGRSYYTLVALDMYNGSSYGLTFSKLIKSPNDNAKDAYDLGHVAGNSSTSPFFHVSCHTGAYATDPLPNNYSVNSLGVPTIVPFPDTPNIKRNFQYSNQYRKNLWYTFTAHGSSKINLKITARNNYTNYYYFVSVYKYTGNYKHNFADVLQEGFDSTDKSMKLVYSNSYSINNLQFSFNNEACSENRYIVVIDFRPRGSYDDMPVLEMQVEVSSVITNAVSDGDFCKDGILGNYKNYGNYIMKADNTCHSYGNSPYEEVFDANLKSTWFHIHVSDLEKFDLKIKNLRGDGLKRFGVYGGTCGGLTRIAELNDRYGYFTLSCMGSGDYYIQAVCNKTIAEELQFEVSIIDASNAACKPYDFIYPIAQFKTNGGCQYNDSIFCTNQSTRGEDMTYAWIVNNVLRGKDLHFFMLRTDTLLKDKNTIRLIVTNEAENIKDTFDQTYYKDTQIYKFKVLGKSTYKCIDSMNLMVQTDYPHRINYTWQYSFSSFPLSDKPFLFQERVRPALYYVTGKSDNCYFKDSFQVNMLGSLHKYKDSTLCGGRPYPVSNTSTDRSIYFYDSSGTYTFVEPGETKNITKSGTYSILYFDGNFCGYIDTIKVTIIPGPDKINLNKNIYACNVASYKLQPDQYQLKKYYWNTGDTTPFITVTKSGIYTLSGPLKLCQSLSLYATVKIEQVNTDILRDTILCKYDSFTFKNPYAPSFQTLYKSPLEDMLHVVKPVPRVLKIQRGDCTIEDSALTALFPHASRSIDTFYCENRIQFSFVLDGGKAINHNWYLQNQSRQILIAEKYGFYPVARTDLYGCKDTLKFNLITDCAFNVYIPNAFTPNDDYLNEGFGPTVSGRYKGYSMRIFNRWGEMILETNDQPWFGNYKDAIVMPGVYTYLITVFDENNKPFVFRGTVTVLL